MFVKIYKLSSNIIKQIPRTINPANLSVSVKNIHEICLFFAMSNKETSFKKTYSSVKEPIFHTSGLAFSFFLYLFLF